MQPICFEESLPQAFSAPCPEYLSIATEQYLKDVMSAVFFRTRSDLGLNGGNEVKTHSLGMGLRRPKKRRRSNSNIDAQAQAEREKERKERERWMRRPMNAGDLRFALGRGDLGFGQSKAIVKRVMSSGWEEGVLEGWSKPPPPPSPLESFDVAPATAEVVAAATADGADQPPAPPKKPTHPAPPPPLINAIYDGE
ncbi:MAG: hypothetical protein Q9191_007218, partial [Dirinaria sp. TL-2023a]